MRGRFLKDDNISDIGTMYLLADLIDLELLKTVLEYLGMISAAAFGVIGTLFDNHREETHVIDGKVVTRKILIKWGKVAIVGIVLSLLVSASSKVIEYKISKDNEAKTKDFQDSVLIRLQASLKSAQDLSDSSSLIVGKLESVEGRERENLEKSEGILDGTLSGLNPLFPITVNINYKIKLSKEEKDTLLGIMGGMPSPLEDTGAYVSWRYGTMIFFDRHPEQWPKEKFVARLRTYLRDPYFRKFDIFINEGKWPHDRYVIFELMSYPQLSRMEFHYLEHSGELYARAYFSESGGNSSEFKIKSLYEIKGGSISVQSEESLGDAFTLNSIYFSSGPYDDQYLIMPKRKGKYYSIPISEVLKGRQKEKKKRIP